MDKPEDFLAVLREPRSIVAENYRGLRTSIQRALNGGVRTMMFVSVYGGDGKTTVCCNIAVALTQLFLDVVLVDCDLRRPTVSNLFKMLEVEGLGDYLVGQATLDAIIRDTDVERLKIVPAGRVLDNPGDLLGRPALANFCSAIRERADVTIFDTSPLSACSDALSLGPHLDTCAMVISPKRWDGEVEVKARQQLDQAKIPVMGIILNGTDPSGDRGYGYGYGYGYGGRYGSKNGAGDSTYGYYGYGEEPEPSSPRRRKSWLGRIKELFGPDGG